MFAGARYAVFGYPYSIYYLNNPVLDTGSEADTLNGGDGWDYLFAGFNDTVDGGASSEDVLYLSLLGATSGVTLDFHQSVLTNGSGTISGIEGVGWLQGSNYDDDITLSSIGNYAPGAIVYAMGGNDRVIADYRANGIFGGAGNDFLDGRGSQYLQMLDGGDGDDTLYTNANSGAAAYGGAGNDTIHAHGITYGGSGNDLILLDVTYYRGGVYGEDGDDEIRAASMGNEISGGAGADHLVGNDGADTLASGNFSENSYTPLADMGLEKDVLTGGGGDDLLAVGYGDDADGGAGFDTLQLSFGGAGAGVNFNAGQVVGTGPFTFGGGVIQNVERVTYLRGSEFADNLSLASMVAGKIDGGAGDDIIQGSLSIDLLIGGAGKDTITGGEGVDRLEGGDDNDWLDGGAGGDTMFGGDGDDVYIVDDGGDRAIEVSAAGGKDEVRASVSFTLEVDVEMLTLTGGGAIDAAGNGSANLIIGNAAANVLEGMGGNDTLRGGAGNDRLNGGAGNDSLIGEEGQDVLAGGVGDDSYLIDAGDTIVEAAGEGRDTVYVTTGYALGAGAAVEVLTVYDRATTNALTLSGNEFANSLYGNMGSNGLIGGGGSDVLYGLGGDDAYIVDDASDQVVEAAGQGWDTVYALGSYALAFGSEVEVLTAYDRAGTIAINLTGNDASNLVYGNMGNNGLVGGGGTDTLYGLGDDDSYIVDDASDRVIELAGQGWDTVYALGSYALAADAEVEVLTAYDRSGTTAINLTGSASGNILYGNMGVNGLIGGGGSDTLYGLGGDDSYIVDDASDQVIEFAGQGWDTVYALGDFTLSAGSEVETLTAYDRDAATALKLTGNALANNIYGDAGANVLDGKGGADTLYGFSGADKFQFSTTLQPGMAPTVIGDFVSGMDKIALDDAVFGGIAGNALSSMFVTGTAAADADDRLIYDSATGALWYDADGTGAGAAIHFAILQGHPTLTAGDFLIF
ncbi:hypothetical protein MZO42_11485 [Sphingomonas psychrotolerans]|uniref:Calcium-binding protein n=1 Tax=Sphingomonas psychrotolerans TaxID=1327635 RepID=A0ABU3N4X6_9SPHN|nr:calcium-binding protein [Sphingomonas psychrotolerans]MDT8759321.1 hypothetical protein [Sphingomonas psychrotolerans]